MNEGEGEGAGIESGIEGERNEREEDEKRRMDWH